MFSCYTTRWAHGSLIVYQRVQGHCFRAILHYEFMDQLQCIIECQALFSWYTTLWVHGPLVVYYRVPGHCSRAILHYEFMDHLQCIIDSQDIVLALYYTMSSWTTCSVLWSARTLFSCYTTLWVHGPLVVYYRVPGHCSRAIVRYEFMDHLHCIKECQDIVLALNYTLSSMDHLQCSIECQDIVFVLYYTLSSWTTCSVL